MHVGRLRENRNDWKVLRKGTKKDGKGNILIAHLSKLTHKASFKIFKTLKKADKAVVLTNPSYLNNLTFLRFKNRTSFSSTFSDLSKVLNSCISFVKWQSFCGDFSIKKIPTDFFCLNFYSRFDQKLAQYFCKIKFESNLLKSLGSTMMIDLISIWLKP